MALTDSLLSAIVRADGDALVMHVGERPYVVVGTQTINISTHGLNLEVMTGMLTQLLTAEARRPILFRGVKLYDAAGRRFLDDQNVVVADGKISMVGEMLPKLPDGARVIDGKGKTLVPGLWDSHMHIGDDFTALSEVAIGVTSIRNPSSRALRAVNPIKSRYSRERYR